MNTLFAQTNDAPLADRLRPQSLDDVIGQEHLLGDESAIGRMVTNKSLKSMILWGPPGSGKTTIARLLANHMDAYFEQVSAIFSGVADLRKVFDLAKSRQEMGEKTLLFVDEIHRFNKSQQDSFLPFVERGTVTLIGATTENPSFSLNAALLSRCQVMVLNRLDEEALKNMLLRAEIFLEKKLPLDEDGHDYIVSLADGDGRYLLNLVEQLEILPSEPVLSREALTKFVQKRAAVYDKSGEGHYNLISALHKSLRGSDVDAALYWMARMLEGGEDPLYLLRRLVRFSVEDVSLADPHAVTQALAVLDTYRMLGSPEGELAIAQLVTYLAAAPKSNAVYSAYKAVRKIAKETGSLPPPKHILNAPTKMMKDLGYGDGYQYDHDTKDGFSGQNYFPEGMQRMKFYHPVERGFERDMKKRIDYFEKLRDKKEGGGEG
ncbi:MAG: replication-associated recombination protein A [Alphaproteobacteria bacterium]